MNFNSTAQAGQDIFAFKMCGEGLVKSFLDVGAFNLVMCNNSYSLEQLGWRGICCDQYKDEANLSKRTAKFIHGDARKVDWLKEIDAAGLPRTIDYLSLDVDDATLETLQNMPLKEVRFNVVTIETDRYRLGDGPRNAIREIMMGHDYDLVCEDVMVDYPEGQINAFEEWFCSKELSVRANKFRCKGKHWKEIVAA